MGTVVGIRFPVIFSGSNKFKSNNGGGISMNHARVTINGKMLFRDNFGAAIGGAMRIGENTLVSLWFICNVYGSYLSVSYLASCYAQYTLNFHQQQCFTIGRSYCCGKC